LRGLFYRRIEFMKSELVSGHVLHAATRDDLALLDGVAVTPMPLWSTRVALSRPKTPTTESTGPWDILMGRRVVVRPLTVNNFEFSSHGMVVLETSAPTQAILCSTLDYKCRSNPMEQKFIVDRRRLRSVHVIERLEAMTLFERGKPSPPMASSKSRTIGLIMQTNHAIKPNQRNDLCQHLPCMAQFLNHDCLLPAREIQRGIECEFEWRGSQLARLR
jgi:hypothetical protein